MKDSRHAAMGEHHFLFSRGSLGVWPEEHTTEPSCIIPEPGEGNRVCEKASCQLSTLFLSSWGYERTIYTLKQDVL